MRGTQFLLQQTWEITLTAEKYAFFPIKYNSPLLNLLLFLTKFMIMILNVRIRATLSIQWPYANVVVELILSSNKFEWKHAKWNVLHLKSTKIYFKLLQVIHAGEFHSNKIFVTTLLCKKSALLYSFNWRFKIILKINWSQYVKLRLIL